MEMCSKSYQEICDNTESSVIKFTYQGLYRLCEILPLKEVLKCRLVCKRWEIFINCIPRFTRSVTKFSDNIYSISGDALQVAKEREIYWRSVHLNFFPFIRSNDLISYWRVSGEFVTTLWLKNLEVVCIDLVNFLNECPSVRDITFEDNGFRPKFPKKCVRRCMRKVAIFCSHQRLDKKFHPSSEMSPFTSVTFSSQNVVPRCLLAYISLRTQGKLEKFTFEHATCISSVRSRLQPTKEEVENHFLQMVQENAHSLKKLAVKNCIDIGNFLNRVALVENLSLDKLHFDPTRLPSLLWKIDESFGLNILESQQGKFIRSLEIGFHDPDATRLQQLFSNYGSTNTLRQLKITVAKGYNDITPMLTKLENLVELEIKELGYFRRNSLTVNGNPIRGINPIYLASLPRSLQSLIITHTARGDNITQLLLQNSVPICLKHLKIDYAFTNDQMCQQIISSFPLLETLLIRNSRFLTDVGVTGMNANTCKYLRKNHCADDLQFNFDNQFSISHLINLRVLSLYGCRNISDISLTYGIKLDKLRILDVSLCKHVTEAGILSVTTNNLELERLILYDLLLPTNCVANMKDVNRKLKKIHLSQATLVKQRVKYGTDEISSDVAVLDELFTEESYPL